jgi:TPR repeat protein
VAEISNGRMTPQLREISVENGELVFIPVQAVKGDASPSRQISQMQVGGQRLLAQAGSTYGYSDFLGVMNTMSYRFATNMADQERVWRRRLEQMRDHAAAGNPWAMAALSYAYDRGLGAEPNAKLASFWAAEAFDTGHPVGAFALARCVKNGCNGSPNPILARELIRRSDSGGFAPATAWLAEENLFQQPAGDSGSASATLPKLAAAAEGIHWAEFAVARAYADPPSKSITKDLRKAAQIFERLANQGYPQAQNQMFRLRYMGVDGVARRDPDSARRWLESAAALGDRESQYWLAAAYYQEPGFLAVKLGMPKNFALALQWAELAAKQKEPGGLMLLANAHQYGRGVPVDFAKARQFCESAIELNDSDALVVMAGWLLEGEVVARNDQQAVQLLTRAVAQQNPNAMFLLGTCYEQARGLDLQGQSPREMRPHLYHHALHHYIQAAQRDHPDATAKVESFLKQVRRHEPEVGSFEDLVQGGDWPAKDFLQPLRRAYPESYLWIESRLQGKR